MVWTVGVQLQQLHPSWGSQGTGLHHIFSIGNLKHMECCLDRSERSSRLVCTRVYTIHAMFRRSFLPIELKVVGQFPRPVSALDVFDMIPIYSIDRNFHEHDHLIAHPIFNTVSTNLVLSYIAYVPCRLFT